jgi:hypothetical protein
MSIEEPLTVSCGDHGKQVAAVVCCHMLETKDRVLGFVENSSDPNDLQAWCGDCEELFQREQEMTDGFRKFNDMSIVCIACYAMFRDRHTKPK